MSGGGIFFDSFPFDEGVEEAEVDEDEMGVIETGAIETEGVFVVVETEENVEID